MDEEICINCLFQDKCSKHKTNIYWSEETVGYIAPREEEKK